MDTVLDEEDRERETEYSSGIPANKSVATRIRQKPLRLRINFPSCYHLDVSESFAIPGASSGFVFKYKKDHRKAEHDANANASAH